MAKAGAQFTIVGDSKGATQAVSQLVKALDRLPGIIKKLNTVADKFGKTADSALKKVNKSAEMLDTRMEKLSQSTKDAGTGVTSVSRRLGTLDTKAETAKNSVADLNNQLKTLGKAKVSNVSAPVQAPKPVAAPTTDPIAGMVSDLRGQFTFMPVAQQMAIKAFNSIAGAARTATPIVAGFAAKIAAGFAVAIPAAVAGVVLLQKSILGLGQAMTKNVSTAFANFSRSFNTLRQGIQNVFDSVRLGSQAVGMLGRTMSIWIGLPLGAVLTSMTKTALSFEDAMIRVGKTSGVWGDQLEYLTLRIRELATETRTSHGDLAKMAEQIGQLGVSNPDAIVNLVEIVNMLAVTTDLSADSVAESVGKIASAFGWNLNSEQGVKNVYGLANAINMLENETAASADEIVDATLKFAQSAKTMNMSAASAAAFGATLVGMGFDASEAGTAMKNATLYMVKNIEKLQQALGLNEKYNTVAKTQAALNEDSVQVFLDLASATEGSNNQAQTLLDLMDLGNMRGGRALLAMANDAELFRKNLVAANKEFASGNSLFIEYQRSLSSSQAHLEVMRNNLTDIGITFSNTFLPIINKLTQILIPALRMANEYFKKLPDSTKMWIVGIALALVALGPILMILSSILYAVALIGVAFSRLVGIVSTVSTVLSWLFGAFSGIFGILVSWPVIIGGAVVAVLKILAEFGVDIAGFFINLATKAAEWGESFSRMLGDGIIGGAVRYVMAAVSFVANLIASFFESHSPPKVGPLSTIDKWGSGLMKTFLKGFTNADFSILNDVGKTIERILMSAAGGDEKAQMGALRMLAEARVQLANLIDQFNKTGEISESVLDGIVSGLGSMREDVKKLITLWLQYNSIQQKLADLDKSRKGVDDLYKSEMEAIGDLNMSMEDRVIAIRKAQQKRDDSLRSLDAEQVALEEQKNEVKEQLDYQQSMIDTLQDQEDIFTRIADLAERIAESMSGGGGGGGGGGGLEGDLAEDWEEAMGVMDEAREKFDLFESKINAGKDALAGFFDAMAGKKKKPFDPGAANRDQGPSKEEYGMYETMYKLGEQVSIIKGKFDEFKTTIEGWKEAWGPTIDLVKEKLEGFRETMDRIRNEGLVGKGLNDAKTKIGGIFDDIKKKVQGSSVFQGLSAALRPAIAIFKLAGKSFNVLKETWSDMVAEIKKNQGLMTAISWTFKILGFILLVLVGAVAAVVAALFLLPTITWRVTVAFLRFINAIDIFVQNGRKKLVEFFTNLGAKIWEALQKAEDTVKEKLNEILIAFGITEGVRERWSQIWEDIKLIASEVWDRIKTAVVTKLGELWTTVSTEATKIWNSFVEAITPVAESVGTALTNVWTSIVTAFETLWTNITTWWAEKVDPILQIGVSFVQGLIDGIQSMTEAVIGTVTTLVEGLIANIKSRLGIASPSTVTNAFGLDFVQGLIDGITTRWETLITNLGTLIQSSVDLVAEYIDKFVDAGKSMIGGIWSGVEEKWEQFTGWLSGKIEDLPEWVKKLLGIASPSKVFAELGRYTMEGFIQGFKDAAEDMEKIFMDSIGAKPFVSHFSMIADTIVPNQPAFSSAFGSPNIISGPLPAPVIKVDIHDNTVRSDDDLKDLANKVAVELGARVRTSGKFGGKTQF